MPVDSFEKNNFGWQVQQFRQQVEEWLELTLSNVPEPNPSLPPWLIKVAFWLILGLFFSWLVWQLFSRISPYLSSWRLQAEKLASQPNQVQAVELSVADWLRRSQELQLQGNYREACRALYMAMLQRLNDTKVVPHQPSRTDGEYLQLVRGLPQSQPYQTLLTIHEQLYFGNTAITSSMLERCQQAYREIEAT